MIVPLALVLGAVVGWLRGRRVQGNAWDCAQYAAVHALIFAVLAVFAVIAIDRLQR